MPKAGAKNTTISSDFTVCKFPRDGSGLLRSSEILLHEIWRQRKDDPTNNSETLAKGLVDGILDCEAEDIEDVKVQLRVLEDIKEHETWRFEDRESVEELSKREHWIGIQALTFIRCDILKIDSLTISSYGWNDRMDGLPVLPKSEAAAQRVAKIVVDNTAPVAA